MKIRKANQKDIKELTKLFNESKFLRPLDYKKEEEYNEKEIKDYLKKKNLNYFIVAQENKKILGALLAEFWSDYVYLHLLIVDKNYQNKGIGEKLLEEFDKQVKKRKRKLVEVLIEENNSLMKKIMKKRGYKPAKLFRYFVKIIK